MSQEITNKVKKYLNNNIWYHGTVSSTWKSFCKNGILADYNKNTSSDLDFGYGFYLAPSKERAERYILDMMKNTDFYNDSDEPMILGFEFKPLVLFESKDYNTKVFDKYNDDFAIFVFENRTMNINGSNQHNYDIIFGVMSDSVPTIEIQKYKMGISSKEEVLEALKKSTSMKQLSLHNQNICDLIKLNEAYIINKDTNERKELDVNEYNKQRIS